MRLVCISDTHSLHEKMPPIPDGDVLVHAGDCTGSGTLPQVDEFTRWMGALPHKNKILVAGNHDFCFDKSLRDPTWAVWSRNMCEQNGINYLRGESVSIDGVNFFGFPWQPILRFMAFNAREQERRARLRLVPDDTHVLITHGPALRIFDWIPDIGEHVGCFPLAQRIDELTQLKAHICGHIHESYGFAQRESDGVKFANASTCTERYKPTNPPIIIDL